MQKIILSSLRNDPILSARIDQAFVEAEKVLRKDHLQNTSDSVFVAQHEVDAPLGVEFARDRNLVKFFVQTSEAPSLGVLRATILQAICLQELDAKFARDLKDDFVSDLFRAGLAFFYAFGKPESEAEISSQDFDKLLSLAKEVTSGRLPYDQEFWFDFLDIYPKIWLFGAEIASKIAEKQQIVPLKLKTSDFRNYLDR